MSKSTWVFGIHTINNVLTRTPERILELHVQDGRQDHRMRDVLESAEQAGVPVNTVQKKQLDHWVEQQNHQGVVAKCRTQEPQNEDRLMSIVAQADNPLLLVLDTVTDPHNLGACLRTADAVGAHAVIAPRDKSVGLTPTVRKVAVGAAEIVPFVQVTNLARCLRALQDAGVWVVGTAIDETAQPLYSVELAGPTAVVMGAEGTGLRRLTRETCDQLVYIPMAGGVSSLNVSVATGVTLFEVLRQRMANQGMSN